MTATTPTRTTLGTSAAAILASLASTEGPVTIHERVLTFEDGTTIDLAPWAQEGAAPRRQSVRDRVVCEIARDDWANVDGVAFDEHPEVSDGWGDELCYVRAWLRVSLDNTALDERAVEAAAEMLRAAGYEPINDNSFYLERCGVAVDTWGLPDDLRDAWDLLTTSWEIQK